MRVTAVGDNCVDRYVEEGIAFPGGSCANAAVFARRLGMDAAYVGVIGSDESGSLIWRALDEEGVDLSHAIHADEPSSTTDIRVEDGNRVFTHFVPPQTPITLNEATKRYLRGSTWIHTGHSSGTEHLLPMMREAAPIAFDFSYRDLSYASEILPHVDMATFSREALDEDGCVELLYASRAAGVHIALVTRGALGAIVLVGDQTYSSPAESIQVVDTIGAGDAFQIAFFSAVARKMAPEAAMLLATRFAADVCSHRGAFGHQTTMTGKVG
jgi:fructoselysine 6-kinase